MTATRSGSFPWRFLALVTTTAALLGGAVVAVDVAAAAQHSTVLAKHCKSKCHKAKATRYLAGHRYSYFAGSVVTNKSLDLDLCADGTLRASGHQLLYRQGEYDFSFDGRWSVISATRWKTGVAFTTANYQANNPPSIQPDPPPAAGVLRLWIKARSAVGIRDGGGLFDPLQGPLSRTGLPSGSCPVAGEPGA